MKKGLVIYKSKYGATKKYADWLSEIMDYDIVETSKASLQQAKEYEAIVLCGGIYASGVAGISFLQKNFDDLKDKKIAVFCAGASPFDEDAMKALRERNLKGDMGGIPLFYGRGAWDEDNMSFKDRTMCKMLQKAVGKKDPETYEPWMKALMGAIGQKCDWTDRENLGPLISFLNN